MEETNHIQMYNYVVLNLIAWIIVNDLNNLGVLVTSDLNSELSLRVRRVQTKNDSCMYATYIMVSWEPEGR